MKRMTQLAGPLAAVLLILGSVIVTDVTPAAQAADDAKGHVYLIGLPGAT